MTSFKITDREREILRRELYHVEQRKRDTEERLKVVADRERRLLGNFGDQQKADILATNAEPVESTKRSRAEMEAPTGDSSTEMKAEEPQVQEQETSNIPEKVDQEKEKQENQEPELLQTEQSEEPLEKRPRRVLKIGDQSRDRRLMQGLRGYLMKGKQEFAPGSERKESPFLSKMHRVEIRLAADKEEQRNKEQSLLLEEKEKQTKLLESLTHRAEQLQKAFSRTYPEEREILLAHFLPTKTQPPIYFLPSHHTAETRKCLEVQKEAAVAKFMEFRRQLETLLQDVETNSIEKLLPYKQPLRGQGELEKGKQSAQIRRDVQEVGPRGREGREERSREEVEEMAAAREREQQDHPVVVEDPDNTSRTVEASV
eukprot:NODE_2438_length_1200_cov_46.246742_g2223_i0.p1 GENE.NODE_2438_length_1200_cov_46.246742_g2223_i0~~NODE_2438_length_1200_cov_46.246742_g2223_i0.p1  ORF type:complete len:372 (-),score=71.56 NODE_2438_length_1200_cov_46.246742_g2223_i0:29-1144(-)